MSSGPWLVWSAEHNAWWRPKQCGYTASVLEAGRYDYETARNICRLANYRAGSAHEGTGIPSEIMAPSPEWLARLDAGS